MYRWFALLLLGSQWSAAPAQPIEPLELDFTLPTAAVVDGVGRLLGIAVNPERETVALLNDDQELVFMNLDGELLERRQLPTKARLSGVEWPGEEDLLLIARSGRVYRYDLASSTLTCINRLPERLSTHSVAYSKQRDVIYAIGKHRSSDHVLISLHPKKRGWARKRCA